MPPVADIAIIAGAVAAMTLITALVVGLVDPTRGIWPAPPVGSLRSFVFWSLFRVANAALLFSAAWRLGSSGGNSALQLVALTASATFGVLYLSTLWALGRQATYCAASGLNSTGVYRWTRNPQYVAAIAAYATLAAGVGSADTAALAAANIAIYALMAHAEEPWLRQRYGAAYAEYAARTPRFIGIAALSSAASDAIRQLASGRQSAR